MSDCGHVFCVSCLQDFYNNAITEGDITSVKCLSPGCAKERSERSKSKSKKRKTFVTPGELLQIPIEPNLVKRYVDLKHKAEVESDKNTVYCPRKWCQGAARSNKYKKPQGLEISEHSDSESDEESKVEKKGVAARTDLMRVCEDCAFAFCSRCYQGWHGEYMMCTPRRENGEMTEEDKASYEYLKLYSTPCPTCAAPAQKTHGCNHMICFVCSDHFCYLCQAYLEPGNPYQHYNVSTSPCYMRLWELEGGDGDDVGIGFAGGRHDEEALRLADLEDDVADIAEEGFAIVEDPRPAAQVQAQPQPQPAPPAGPLQPALVRENPLVLRINELPARPVQPVIQEPARPRRHQLQRPVPQQIQGPFVQRQPGRRHAQAVARLAAERQAEADQRFHRRQQNRHPPRQQQQQRQQQQPPRQLARQNPQVPAIAIPADNPDVVQNDGARAAQDDDEVQARAWVQRFVHMALNDEEDLIDWDSDDEEDVGRWDIPVR